MHKKSPKICAGCRVSEAKIYLYHSSKIAKAKPHSVEISLKLWKSFETDFFWKTPLLSISQ